jgi:hypothetical protein
VPRTSRSEPRYSSPPHRNSRIAVGRDIDPPPVTHAGAWAVGPVIDGKNYSAPIQLERLADGSYTFDFSQAPPGLHNLTRAESAGARNVMRPALAREHRGLPIGGISDFSPMDSASDSSHGYVVGSKAAEAGLDLRMTYSSPRPR